MSDEKSSRAELRQQLQRLGVETVTANYDGCGDSGQIEEPEFGVNNVPPTVVMGVQNLFYDLLESHYAGWEINEGSFGMFEWGVRADCISLTHSMRTEVTEEQIL
jgi:hypothetical protein